MNTGKNTILISIIVVLVVALITLIGVGLFVFVDITSNKNETASVQTEPAEAVESDGFAEIESGEKDAENSDMQITTMYVANVENSIYLRSEPEENSSNIITTIPLGAQVVWISDETPVFSKVSYGGNTGYVKRDYLSSTPPNTSAPQPYTAYTNNTVIYKYMYVANVKNSIYLRKSAEENPNNIITTIPLGTRIGFIEYATQDFSKINYNGTIGYAKTMYLADYYDSGYDYMTVCNVKNSIYLRSEPYEDPSNIICEIPVNSAVRFISNAGGGFYKISWGGYVGYSKSAYLR